MLKQDWSVANEIKKRAEKEAWAEFWEKLEPAKLIELKKIKINKNSIWMWNIIREALTNLKP